jgi:fused signal recognition particle receptor
MPEWIYIALAIATVGIVLFVATRRKALPAAEGRKELPKAESEAEADAKAKSGAKAKVQGKPDGAQESGEPISKRGSKPGSKPGSEDTAAETSVAEASSPSAIQAPEGAGDAPHSPDSGDQESGQAAGLPKMRRPADDIPRFDIPPPPQFGEPVPLPRDKPKTLGVPSQEPQSEPEERDSYRRGLAKTRGGFVAKLARLFQGRPKVDAALHDQVEEVLLTADIGTATAEKLLDKVSDVLDKEEVADPELVWSVIRTEAFELLDLAAEPSNFTPDPPPYVLLIIGVNGVGKTTTLGKLAAQHAAAGRKVLLVAGDTFRAAAVEQLEVWATRVGCSVHKGDAQADPSSVIFDGIARGRREGFDVVLCDTAGRLHTRKELMDELAKVRRAATKAIAMGLPESERDHLKGPHDTYLVLDATIGQNALSQANMFKETMDFTGLVVTKLDGTAKGGVVLGICDEMRVPIRYIGVGEGMDDLQPFSARRFVDALVAEG